MRRPRIVIFAKRPVAGQVKTRLIPALGADGAARLAAEMLDRTVEEARATALDVELWGDPDPAGWFSGDVALSPQGEGNLGERLARAAAHPPLLIIGTDCPDLDRYRLRAAADSLGAHDAVIHPAADGGYVLLGLSRFHPSIFTGIAWSTATVCAETLARLDALGWSVDVRETLRDVDEPAVLGLVGLG